jgi:ubiquinone/menaquinone biosynthesis C-methylase UbiE
VSERSWIFDEEVHAGREHLDAAYVNTYDRKASLDPRLELATLRDLGLGAGTSLLDFGAGTGELALAAATICDRVYAVDVSAAMVGSIRAKARVRKVTNLQIVRAGFLTYEHQGDSVDFVHTRNALHHLPDFWKAIALERIVRILKPGGVLRLIDIVFNFDPGQAEEVIEAWLTDAPDHPGLGWTRGELELHLREEHSTFTWLLEPMLRRTGFEIRDIAHSKSGVHASYTCIRR